MSNHFNKFKILTCTNNPVDFNNIAINRLLTNKPKSRGSLNQFFNNFDSKININKCPSMKKINKNGRKSAVMFSNNPSTVETSVSNSIFDGSVNTKNQVSFGFKFTKQNKEQSERKSVPKALIYYVPKHIKNKLIFDIVFGHYYILSKNKEDIKKLDVFIFEMQKKFNKKTRKLYSKDMIEIINDNNNNEGSEISSTVRTKRDDFNNNAGKYFEIQEKLYFFKKLEDLLALYSLILFYYIKNRNKYKAKTIYLIMINQNLKCMNYLENLIDFKLLVSEKNNRNLLRIFQITMKIQLKIYNFLIKYAFFLQISYYGNLFMKKYFNLSHKFYLFWTGVHKMKCSEIENENQVKQWFCQLNYYSTYYSIFNYLPLSIPISLCNVILNIYNNIDDRYYELKDKNLILCTLYNKSILLYVNGQSEEAINSLKEVKKKLFLFIEDNYIEEEKTTPLKNITHSSLLVDNKKKSKNKSKSKNKNKRKGLSSIQKLFKVISKSRILLKNASKKALSNNSKKQIINMNKKFENYFLSNAPFNIFNFVNYYLKIYNIKIEGTEGKINPKATFSKKIKKYESISPYRRSFLQLTEVDKNKLRYLPNIFKSPFLMKTELLLGEIEIDRKNYRAAYTYINHSLAIISIFRKIKNIFYLSKYIHEQKIIKEFLNIIDYSNKKDESLLSENQENSSDDDIDNNTLSKSEIYEREYELKKKINVNKKILKEFEKFFVFFTTLSAYQIKVLNDTQPTSEKRNFLPILFQNQFKDCLTIRQIIALENLHEMSLSRYMILKDPSKLILPKNLNINPLYFEQPELFSPRYFLFEKKRKINAQQKERESIQKRTYQIFLLIMKSKNAKIYTQNFLNSNYNYVIKIIENSTQKEINKMIDNPDILIKPIEKFKKKNPGIEKNKLNIRHKSQVCIPRKKILNKKLSLMNEYDIKMSLYDKNNLAKNHLKTSYSDKLTNIANYNLINRTCTSSDNKYIAFSKNSKKENNFNKNNSKKDNFDSFKSISISFD